MGLRTEYVMLKRAILMLLIGTAAAPLAAQTADLGRRVDKLESQMRAVQRKVFPEGAGAAALQPEIVPQTAPVTPLGTPATSPVADLTARVDAIEGQLRTITDRTERDAHRLQLLEDQVAALKADAEARAKAAAEAATPAPAPAPAADETPPAPSPAAAGVQRPSTGDPAEDAYIYGYRLWQAKAYPEAEAALKDVTAKYPDSRRASFAQNLLGRAYLDEGKPALASVAFYDNYQKWPKGERAPESLYWLGVSLTQLKKPADACKVYAQLTDEYGATIGASLKAQVAEGQKKAKCGD